MRKIALIIFVSLVTVNVSESQVLISLLFGDKLNSEKIKFGLDGGVNFSSISGIESQKMLVSWNLGFYFDFQLKESTKWYIHTGVLVKSTMGARDIEYTSLGDPGLDSLFLTGTKDRKLSYFNVPILMKYRFKNGVFVELGPMLSLLYKGYDVYSTEYADNDLSFVYDFKKQTNRVDVGVEGGVGYYLNNRDGVYLGLRYYQGLRNIPKEATSNLSEVNTSYFIYASIPIGAGEKGQAKSAAAKQKKDARKAAKAAKKPKG